MYVLVRGTGSQFRLSLLEPEREVIHDREQGEKFDLDLFALQIAQSWGYYRWSSRIV